MPPPFPRRSGIRMTARQLGSSRWQGDQCPYRCTYAARIRPADPPEARSCPCGDSLRSPYHLTHECTRFLQHCINAAIFSFHRTTPFTQLFSSMKGAYKLLTFLQESRAASRPETGPLDVPPEPD